MWANGVVVPSPALDDHPGFLQRVEDFAVEQLVTELRVEAFTIAILPWAAWFDVGGFDSNGCEPLADGPGDELWAIARQEFGRREALTACGA